MKSYAVFHETKYSYGASVDIGQHLLRMMPLNLTRQRLVTHEIHVEPEPARLTRYDDHFGNAVHHVSVETPHDAFVVTMRTTVEVSAPGWHAVPEGPAWESVRDQMSDDSFPSPPEVAEFVFASRLVPFVAETTAYAQESFSADRPIVTAVADLTRRINSDFQYAPGVTDIFTSISEIMESRSGVCQDFSHAMIAGLRGLGLPARYVSGYLRTYPPDFGDGWRGADATHAWVSVWCGAELGWLDFDPTNNLLVSDEHIATAYGRDFSDVTPLRGVIRGGGTHSLAVTVTVSSLDGAGS